MTWRSEAAPRTQNHGRGYTPPNPEPPNQPKHAHAIPAMPSPYPDCAPQRCNHACAQHLCTPARGC
eukprot:2241268-Alexandrium_andersonii.AAC.1